MSFATQVIKNMSLNITAGLIGAGVGYSSTYLISVIMKRALQDNSGMSIVCLLNQAELSVLSLCFTTVVICAIVAVFKRINALSNNSMASMVSGGNITTYIMTWAITPLSIATAILVLPVYIYKYLITRSLNFSMASHCFPGLITIGTILFSFFGVYQILNFPRYIKQVNSYRRTVSILMFIMIECIILFFIWFNFTRVPGFTFSSISPKLASLYIGLVLLYNALVAISYNALIYISNRKAPKPIKKTKNE
ncbi:hypothetical protein NEOKW01_1496 [Nematocida sp. AWRm80]|nr:hypothetical protein NEOKW01_1496 [Nematocida sp. AWRm80]